MRRKDREITDIGEILQIVDRAKILHLGLFDGEYPYIVPLHFGYAYENDRLTFFMHGAKEGHKLDLIRENPNACVELECDIEFVSGGDDPCVYGSTFASVMGWGKAEIVSADDEKIRGLKLLMKNQTGRAFEIDARMASAVAVMKVTLERFTAKARKKQG